MYVRAVRSEQVRECSERAERRDRDEELHFDLRSQIERSQCAPCEIEARQ